MGINIERDFHAGVQKFQISLQGVVWASLLASCCRLQELENQLATLEASKPSAPPALKFKVLYCFVKYHYYNV